MIDNFHYKITILIKPRYKRMKPPSSTKLNIQTSGLRCTNDVFQLFDLDDVIFSSEYI